MGAGGRFLQVQNSTSKETRLHTQIKEKTKQESCLQWFHKALQCVEYFVVGSFPYESKWRFHMEVPIVRGVHAHKIEIWTHSSGYDA